ncbi:PucR family transcriptional regulator [Sphaerisporangium sp. TRM90804]|uniref:PucR family transcriptional regulator n=1 Tax=Sphaerisporangium sp. TRM90804 TaxID=3031113 RepID=UPI00244CB586|nr:PucR family transcriptional regulator [Sphaerisporangium sp. TRM90804]MDH2425252.1 PucR family transcriptional regulator [Sphaerisporangium sp. TRM90804]
MAPTLRRVVGMAPLRLRVLAGEAALDRPVRWVAVSELADPTPFLEGGELVLTTGMRLGPDDAPAYVASLVARGVTGMGFGVGLGHDEVPPAFLDEAARAGLPLVEVPRQTPFIAIGKAVSELLAAERHEELGDAVAAQGRLTRAALRPGGLGAVVERLAREIHGWAALLDEAGTALHLAGEGAAEGAGLVLPELGRLRAPGPPAGLALSGPHEHVVVQPLADRRRVRGFLAVGSRRPFSPVGNTVVTTAGSLLTLSLEQGADQVAATRRVRAAVLRLLLAGERRAAEETLEAVGGTIPGGPVVVLACEPRDAEELMDTLPGFTAPWESLVIAVVPEDLADQAERAAGAAGRAGVGTPVGLDEVATGFDQARRALASASPVARFAELAGQGLLSLVDPALLAGFATALLAPLREYGSRADLVESLRAYLACNGHWDAAAQRLGVHRHTLRYRMRRVGELLGRDLDDPAARAELWVALSVQSGTGSTSLRTR